MSRFVTYPKKADANATIRRFEPAYWTVDFPISMMATVVTIGPNSLHVEALFRFDGDLMGLIWETEDRDDAGTFAYPRRKDYRGVVLEFDWASAGIRPLDLLNAPSLVVETYAGPIHNVRLWNYKTAGTPEACHIRLDFDEVKSGFAADVAVPWEDIKRIYISLVPVGYVEGGATHLGETAAQLDLSNIAVTGAGAMLPIRTTPIDAHELRMADGFDNAYPFTPERLVEQVYALGYRDRYVLYLGISKLHSLSWDAGEARYIVDPAKPKLNAPTEQWLADFAARLNAKGIVLIISVSFEILGMWMPTDWNQRDYAGNIAQTGWLPPSGLVRPTSAEALEYLRDVMLAALALCPGAPHFQIGEPWWWDGAFSSAAPHIYDADTLTLYHTETGLFAPEPHLDTILGQPDPVHLPYLQWCRDKLGAATLYLRDQVLAVYPAAVSHLLIFSPQILRADAPMMRTLNFAQADWQAPAFDVLQIEDYDWVIAQQASDLPKTWLLATTILGYSLDGNAYGDELVANGNFDAGLDGWTVNHPVPEADHSWTGSALELVNGAGAMVALPGAQSGVTYRVQFDATYLVGGYIAVYAGEANFLNTGQDHSEVTFESGTVHHDFTFVASQAGSPSGEGLYILAGRAVGGADTTVHIDNVSVREVKQTKIHYFAGFNLLPATTWVWRETDKAIMDGFGRGPAAVFVWSREQVTRDGWLFDRQQWKLYPGGTRLATCWRIERTDGVVKAYTSFDRPLTIEGLDYQPVNGFNATQLSADVEMSVADVEVLGSIDSDDITAEDLFAGVYDHAEVEMFVVDWADLSIPKTIVRRGWTGAVSQSGQAFTAELRGLGQRIQQPVIDSYSAECRVDLYSPQCGVNRALFAVDGSVTAVTTGLLGDQPDNRIFFVGDLGKPDGWFDYGELWWTSGRNAGRKTEIRSYTAAGRVELWEPMGLDVAVGDEFTAYAGCDKRAETCQTKFDAMFNFRGEPHVPGQDAMLAYPDPH